METADDPVIDVSYAIVTHSEHTAMMRAMLATFCVAVALTGSAQAQPTALVGATVIDGTDGPVIENAVVVVEDDRLRCVGDAASCEVPAGANRVDLAGRFITPGLVDAHVHFSQTGWVDGRPDGISAPDLYPYAETAKGLKQNPGRWYQSYLCSGITAVYDVGGHPWTTVLPEQAEKDPKAVHVRAAGPLITHVTNAALDLDEEIYTFLPMNSTEEAESSVARLVAMGSSAVKVWYLAPRPERRDVLDERMMEIGAAARAAGLDLIVHATELREAKVALNAGAKLLVHSVRDAPIDDEFLALMKANDAVYAPTLVVGGNWGVAMASIMRNSPFTIDDPNGCVDPNTVEKIADTERLQTYLPERLRNEAAATRALESRTASRDIMAENLRAVHAAGVTVATATDAGNPLTLHGPSIYNEMEAMQEAGLRAPDIIRSATRDGAYAMGRLEDFGTLEKGKIADLIVLAEDPRDDVRAFRSLTHVMRAGMLYLQEELAYR